MLSALLPAEAFAILLVFVRVGAAVMLLPVFGEPFVHPRARLLIALLLALLITPGLAPTLPRLPESVASLALLVLGELLVGVFLGTLARVLMAAFATAGMIIAYMSSLANALVEDPSSAQQGAVAGSFLNMVALLTVVSLDLHHLLLRAVVDSYELFVPGRPLPIGDFSQMVTQVVGASFLLAFQIAAPFVAVGLVFNLGIGLLARLMPQVQVFFIAMPLQIALGLGLLALTLPMVIAWFIHGFRETLLPFVAG